MKRLFLAISIVMTIGAFVLIGGLTMAEQEISEHWTDQIISVGNVRRIYFHALIVTDEGNSEWHYFGTTEAEIPPTSGDPVFEHAFVQLPNDFDDLPVTETQSLFEDLAIVIAQERDGLDITNFFTDDLDRQGVTTTLEFRIQSDDTTWHYYGSSVGAFPCPDGATCNEVSNVAFPRDTGDIPDEFLYDFGLIAGLNREGLR